MGSSPHARPYCRTNCASDSFTTTVEPAVPLSSHTLSCPRVRTRASHSLHLRVCGQHEGIVNEGIVKHTICPL
eukprot:45250-Eustigmatos_ZCMA.PRE.1